MKQLRACIWIGFANNEENQSSKALQRVLEGLVELDVQIDFHAEQNGVWGIFPTVTDTIVFGKKVLETQVDAALSIFITAGELQYNGIQWSGWPIERSRRVLPHVEPNQIWFTETIFHLVDLDHFSWEEVGMVSTEHSSVRSFRLLLSGQSFVPAALKRAIREQKVVVYQNGGEFEPIRKGIHVVFVGFSDNHELYSHVARVNSIVPNDKLWLVLPKIDADSRKQWTDLGRHLIVSEPSVFLDDIQRENLTLVGKEANATMYLDPVSLSSGEVALYGLALPLVPMARIIDGYTVDLLSNGEWGHASDDDAVVRVAVGTNGAFLTSFQTGSRLNSREMEVGKSYPLGNGARLTIGRITHRYIANVGKPYLGLFLGEPTRRSALAVGDRLELGRQPTGSGFALPDRGGSERIDWADTPQAISARNSKLTLDRAMTGRQHVSLTVHEVGKFAVNPLHDKLPTYILPKASQRLQRVTGELVLKGEGLIVVGTNVLKVSKT